MDVLKIDVEGEEYNVLLGANDMLSKTKIVLIELRLRDRELSINLLKEKGFEVKILYSDGLAELDDVRFRNAWNYVAYREHLDVNPLTDHTAT